MYSPLKYWGAAGDKKMTVGVVGIGGLGTMGIKLAKPKEVRERSDSFMLDAGTNFLVVSPRISGI